MQIQPLLHGNQCCMLHFWVVWVNSTRLSGNRLFPRLSPPPLPSGYVVKQLTVDDAAAVDNAWTYRSARSLGIIRDNILHRPCLGIWHSLDNSTDSTHTILQFQE